MSLFERLGETVCALATPPGRSALGVVRLSGSKSLQILKKLSTSSWIQTLQGDQAQFGVTTLTWGQEALDQAVVLFFPESRSFTGEATVEFICHGNPLILDRLTNVLIQEGARAALPGEFSFRAFSNGKIDLAQAENIHSLIAAESAKSVRVSLSQLRGELSRKLHEAEERIIFSLAHLEAEIDFSEEGLVTLTKKKQIENLVEVKDWIEDLSRNYVSGRFLETGVTVALVGRPNVGKSSLLNFLLGTERSIVSEEAGTTRDVVEARLRFSDQLFCFYDTAGIRETSSKVEQKGIFFGQQKLEEADVVVFMVDLGEGFTSQDKKILLEIEPRCKNILIVGNKQDLVPNQDQSLLDLNTRLSELRLEKILGTVLVSTMNLKKREAFLKSLKEATTRALGLKEDLQYQINARQLGLLEKAGRYLSQAIAGLEVEMVFHDLVSSDLREALLAIQEILGKSYEDQIVDKIFKEFCLGK